MLKSQYSLLPFAICALAFAAVNNDRTVAKASTIHAKYNVKKIDDGSYYREARKPHAKYTVDIPTQIVHHKPAPQTAAPQPSPNPAPTPAPAPKPAESPQPAQSTNDKVDDNIAHNAERMVGYFNYAQVRPVANYVTKPGHQLNTVDDVNPEGMTDCSGFVWLTLKVSGYNVGGFPAGSTENMKHLDGGWGNVLEEIPQDQAQPGDIVVVSASMSDGGHTGILDGSYHGDDLVNSDTPFINVSDGTHACKRGPIKWYFATLKYKAPTHVYRVKPSAKLNN